MFIFFEKPKSLIKYSLILLPAILILLFIYIYGGFLFENVSFLTDNKETSSNLELVQNVSLKHQQDFSFIKMLVIRDQAEFKKLSTQTNCGFPSTSASDEFNQSLTRSSRRSARIVRGNEAEPNSFPWMASLKHVRNSIVYEHFCAGSLIYDKYVLTAAHCLTGLSKENFVVVLGTSKQKFTLLINIIKVVIRARLRSLNILSTVNPRKWLLILSETFLFWFTDRHYPYTKSFLRM